MEVSKEELADIVAGTIIATSKITDESISKNDEKVIIDGIHEAYEQGVKDTVTHLIADNMLKESNND